jgi:hypothetical protein
MKEEQLMWLTELILENKEFTVEIWPLLWSSCQSSWLQIQRSRVRFPASPDFLKGNGYGAMSIQPSDGNWWTTWKKISGFGIENCNYRLWGTVALSMRHPFTRRSCNTWPTSGGLSFCRVAFRIKEHWIWFVLFIIEITSDNSRKTFEYLCIHGKIMQIFVS